ncbi:hypothetical protein [Reyranella soli]|uniref:CHAT domain-containing protein n=1 Tax=Reyranella soli TaxID=1230389 RepID=A0A512N9K8_9HYPH|nr:hypothetical protein [Reyranella soli]GEP55613.1 hypothetical protein RSO01_27790 [Reyranella soli]
MNDRKVRIELAIDPLTRLVSRIDGAGSHPIDLSRSRAIDLGEGRTSTLGEVIDTYAEATQFFDVQEFFTVYAQQAIGEILFEALGGAKVLNEEGGWLEIAVCCRPGPGGADVRRELERLPWSFLARPDARGSSFLINDEENPWVVTLDGAPELAREEVLFPPEPRILLMIAGDDPATPGYDPNKDQAPAHEEEILAALKSCYSAAAFVENVKVARRWKDVIALLDAGFAPHVLYFYGHGESDGKSSQLLFRANPGELPRVSPTQIRRVLEDQAARGLRPKIFFANCCHGNSAPRFGLGEELSALVPCLIANRTVAGVEESRLIGLHVLESLARDGTAPDALLADAVRKVLTNVSGSTVGGRWGCPVVYTRYASWIALAPEKRSDIRPVTAGDFPARVDRHEPVKHATAAFASRLGGKGITIDGIAWQAEERQGLTNFSRRLRDVFNEQFTTTPIREWMVRFQAESYPAAGDDSDELVPHFAKSIYAALAGPGDPLRAPDKAVQLNDVVRKLTQSVATAGSTVLFSHEPIDAKRQVFLRDYWLTWAEIRKRIEKNAKAQALRILLAFPLRVGPTDSIDIAKVMAVSDFLSLTPLGVFESVSRDELAGHLRDFTAFYNVLDHQVDRVAADIHTRTNGVFDQTHIALKTKAGIA